MVDLYPNVQYMLKFTNEEILNYLVKPIEEREEIRLNISTYGKGRGSKNRIFSVNFDRKKDDLEILFYDHLIAVFILNEEIPIRK